MTRLIRSFVKNNKLVQTFEWDHTQTTQWRHTSYLLVLMNRTKTETENLYVKTLLSIHHPSIHLPTYLTTYLPACLPTYLSTIHPSIYISIYLSIYLSNCLSVCASIRPSIHPFVCLSICLSVRLPTYTFNSLEKAHLKRIVPKLVNDFPEFH